MKTTTFRRILSISTLSTSFCLVGSGFQSNVSAQEWDNGKSSMDIQSSARENQFTYQRVELTVQERRRIEQEELRKLRLERVRLSNEAQDMRREEYLKNLEMQTQMQAYQAQMAMQQMQQQAMWNQQNLMMRQQMAAQASANYQNPQGRVGYIPVSVPVTIQPAMIGTPVMQSGFGYSVSGGGRTVTVSAGFRR